ncbi:hypothetical protein N7513_012783 [Penicillium frequentans]|nr:hypothetical protein N7513_012783 [Penicillium glabrum]
MSSPPLKKGLPFLPTEVWRQIFILLRWNDPQSLKLASLTNHRLHEIAASIIFRTLQLGALTFCEGRRQRILSSIPWKYVKVIIVTGVAYQTELDDWKKDHFLKMIESAIDLQEFYWQHWRHMPGFALFKLHQLHPQAAVHITGMNVCLAQRKRPHHPIERSIPHLQSLRSLTSEWDYDLQDSISKTPTNVSYQARLRDIICGSHNLETLRLIQREEEEEGESLPPQRGAITLQKGDVLPNLKHLHLFNMHLDNTQSLLWAESLQWETLESLSLINGDWVDLVPEIAKRLSGLKSFEVSISKYHPRMKYWHRIDQTLDPPSPLYLERATQVRLILESMPLLERFIGYSVPQSILDTLSRFHGDSLKHLRFRNMPRAHFSPNEPLWPSSIDHLEILPDQFPNLESLGFDIEWIDEEWPYEPMTHIRQIKHLKHLELNIPSVDLRRYKDVSANLTVNCMDDNAYNRLLEFLESDLNSISLRSLHIKVGEWDNAKWIMEGQFPRDEPLIIGERDQLGSMHFHRVQTVKGYVYPKKLCYKDYARDLYRGILEIHGFDDPFFMDSGKSTRGKFDSGWGVFS